MSTDMLTCRVRHAVTVDYRRVYSVITRESINKKTLTKTSVQTFRLSLVRYPLICYVQVPQVAFAAAERGDWDLQSGA